MDLRALWRRLAGRERDETGWARGELPDGAPAHFDPETVAYLESTAPQPDQHTLDTMLTRARSARLTALVARDGRQDSDLLLEIRDSAELASLAATLRIADGPNGHCMCFGNPHLALFDAAGEPLAELSFHHGKSVRWSAWADDARLLDGRAVLGWFAARGAHTPLAEFEEEQRQRAAEVVAWERWHAATPAALQRYLEPYRETLGMVLFVPAPSATVAGSESGPPLPDGMTAEYFDALAVMFEQQMSDVGERARALFAWLGEGGARWSGFPAYELVPECFLFRMSIDELVGALEDADDAPATWDGAARFLAGWQFGARRAHERALLPDTLRTRLRQRVGDGRDPDRLARLEAAFGSG